MTDGWPYYKAHQVVQAAEIVSVKPDNQGGAVIQINPATENPLILNWQMLRKHTPTVGGFLVCNPTGYFSCLEREAFLDCYTLVGSKKPVDVEWLQRELDKAQDEASDWRIRYETLKDEIDNSVE